jgi:hypothetical protein
VLDLPQPKLHLRITALGGIRLGFAEHFMRHVHANDPSGLPHRAGRQETIKAGPAAEIQDGLPWP